MPSRVAPEQEIAGPLHVAHCFIRRNLPARRTTPYQTAILMTLNGRVNSSIGSTGFWIWSTGASCPQVGHRVMTVGFWLLTGSLLDQHCAMRRDGPKAAPSRSGPSPMEMPHQLGGEQDECQPEETGWLQKLVKRTSISSLVRFNRHDRVLRRRLRDRRSPGACPSSTPCAQVVQR